jgi:hypothetical protein
VKKKPENADAQFLLRLLPHFNRLQPLKNWKLEVKYKMLCSTFTEEKAIRLIVMNVFQKYHQYKPHHLINQRKEKFIAL